MEREVCVYSTRAGYEPFTNWILSLKDGTLRKRIRIRMDRVRHGNYGDHKRFQGIIELRLDFGKGYRIYCGEDGDMLVVLLVGGDKSSQVKDTKMAAEYWRDYYEQT